MPIAHWRNGKPPAVIERMLKTQFLRQRNGMAFIQQADRWRAGLEAPDTLNRGPFW